MLVALPGGHKADLVADALAAKITTLPAALTRTLTWDQGHEMAEHVRFTEETGIEVYFCDPKSHRGSAGSNENTNGLLRQYLPQDPRLPDPDPGRLRRHSRQAQRTPSTHPRVQDTITSTHEPALDTPGRLTFRSARGHGYQGPPRNLRSRSAEISPAATTATVSARRSSSSGRPVASANAPVIRLAPLLCAISRPPTAIILHLHANPAPGRVRELHGRNGLRHEGALPVALSAWERPGLTGRKADMRVGDEA